MGKLNVRCLLVSTALESRNHSVLLRDLLHACKPTKCIQWYVLRWTEISSNSPLKIFLTASFFIKLLRFFEVLEKTWHKCFKPLNHVTQSKNSQQMTSLLISSASLVRRDLYSFSYWKDLNRCLAIRPVRTKMFLNQDRIISKTEQSGHLLCNRDFAFFVFERT